MPRIVRYSGGARFQPVEAPTERPVATDVSGLARGLVQLGSEATEFAADKAKAEAAFEGDLLDTKLLKAINEASRGPDGFLNKQGLNAADYSDYMERLEKTRADLAQEASNELARRTFLRKAARRLEEARAKFDDHSYNQRVKVIEENLKVQVSEAYTRAAEAKTPEEVEDILTQLEFDPPLDEEGNELEEGESTPGAIPRFLLEIKGASPEVVDQYMETYYSEGYSAVIRHKLQNRETTLARAIFEAHKEDIKVDIRDDLESDIRKVEVQEAGTAIATEIARLTRGGELDTINEAMARDLLEENTQGLDPDVAAEARKSLDILIAASNKEADAKRMERYKEAQRYWNSYVMANDPLGSGFYAIPADLMNWLNRNAPDLAGKILDKHRQIIRSQQSAERAAINFQFNNQRDRRRDQEVVDLFNSLTPEQMLATDIDAEYWDQVSPNAIAKMKRDQEKMRRYVDKHGAVSLNQFVGNVLAAAQGVVKSKKDIETLKAQARLAYMALHDEVAKKGRDPLPEETLKLQRSLLSWSQAQIAAGRNLILAPEFQFEADAEARQEALKENTQPPHPVLGKFIEWMVNPQTRKRAPRYERGVDFSAAEDLE